MNRRKKIPELTKRELWSCSGGYCQNPECNKDLFRTVETGGVVSIDELAHIIPYSNDGPRSTSSPDGFDTHSYSNLIVLCPTCHTIVDKSPDNYPAAMLQS